VPFIIIIIIISPISIPFLICARPTTTRRRAPKESKYVNEKKNVIINTVPGAVQSPGFS
jgi:hypothetical protein